MNCHIYPFYFQYIHNLFDHHTRFFQYFNQRFVNYFECILSEQEIDMIEFFQWYQIHPNQILQLFRHLNYILKKIKLLKYLWNFNEAWIEIDIWYIGYYRCVPIFHYFNLYSETYFWSSINCWKFKEMRFQQGGSTNHTTWSILALMQENC